MRKVELRMNEQYKYEIIKKLVETNGNKKAAALKLNCTVRTINRLIHVYKDSGKQGFIHGNRGKAPVTMISSETKAKVIELYTSKYGDANFTHFCEILLKDHNIKISSTTLNRWLREEEVLSPKAHRRTKKHMKRLLKVKLDQTRSEKVKNQIKENIAILDSKEAHPTRPRCKNFGEMIQMDASSFEWVPGQVWHLHLAIDDATGAVTGAYLDTQETLNGYYHVFYQILVNYGIPAMFYTDRRTVFEYKKKNHLFDDEDTFTQFSYACHQLGVEIKTTSVAQAKGRIERLNQTFQSRLPIELRRHHITDMNAANEFLKSYLKEFNEQFALRLNSRQSVFEKQPSSRTINTTLAILSERVIDGGNTIHYKNKVYFPANKNGDNLYFTKGSSVLVIESFEGHLYVNILDKLYWLKEVPSHEEVSRNFDSKTQVTIVKRPWIPPMSHPLKHSSYLAFVAKMKHRNDRCSS